MARDEMQRQADLRRKAWESRPVRRGVNPGQRTVTPRQVARGTVKGGRKVTRVTERRGGVGPKHVLTAELVAGLMIVLVRVVADYEPQSDGTVKGKIGHPKGQYGPLPVAAGLIGTFFFLSFFVAKGGRWATVANAFGALVIVTLGVKSTDEFDKVAATFSDWGKGKKPAGAWETSGVPAGDLTPASGSGSGTTPSPQVPAHLPKGMTAKQWLQQHPNAGVVTPVVPQ